MKRHYSRSFIVVLVVILFLFSGCSTKRMQEYYSEKENYVDASGTITHIAYNDDSTALCLGFSGLTPTFDDTSFEIVGENLEIAKRNGIDDKLKIGDQIDFITAPRYFGDGYVFPIVAISVNGEEILEFEAGLSNFLKWLEIQ